MASIDNRVVAMKFDNAQFEQGVSKTMSTLDRLKAALDFSAPKRGLTDFQGAANKFSLGNMGADVEGVSGKFMALATIGVTALATITHHAVEAGAALVKSFTFGPITAGFSEYETKIRSTQTILANTARHGTKLADVNRELNALNDYADKTIYNFGQMTKNVSLFTNAGIKIEDATSMIKGFSNAAAASGTDAQGAARAAYQLSQALTNGKVTLMDWKSLTNVGMGNKNMQDSLIGIADAMGVVEKKGTSVNKIQQGFNKSLEDGWLTADVMSNYLRIMAGEMSNAEMKALGLSKTQIKGLREQAATAQDAATKVRTFSALMGTLRESIGSSWSETAEILIGDFESATHLWSNVNKHLGGALAGFGERRNQLLKDWDAMGGRTILVQGLTQAFSALGNILKTIGGAFREIFPAMTATRLLELTAAFRDWTGTLKMGAQTTENLKRTLAGFFAIFGIAWEIIKLTTGVIRDLFAAILGEGAGSFLEITASIGDFLVALHKSIKQGELLKGFFEGLSTILQVPLKILGFIGSGIVDMFKGIDPGFLDTIANALERVGEAIGNAFNPENVDASASLLGAGFLGASFLAIKMFIGRVSTLFSGGFFGGGGMVDSIKDTFQALTNSLQSLQTLINAKTLQAIAVALLLLVASMVALSFIDADKMAKALVGLSGAMLVLLGGFQILSMITKTAGFIKMPFIAASLILLSTALLILSAAVKVLSTLSWEELAKGLGAVVILLIGLGVAAKLMSGSEGAILRAGLAMIPLAIGLKILASAVKDFAQMSWGELAKGMASVAAALIIIGVSLRLFPSNMVAIGLGLLAVSYSLSLIADALAAYADMSWAEIGRGLATLAGALLIIGVAMRLMPTNMPIIGAGLVLVGAALNLIADALSKMSEMSWEEMGKGMAALAGSLIILAAGLYAMTGTIGGAIALTIATAALTLLVPVLLALGSMSWETIGKGLAALAGALLVLGLAGYLIAPVVPALIGLGLAIALIGVGVLAAGAGILLFATALTALTVAGTAAIAVVGDWLKMLIDLIPQFMTQLATGIAQFIVVLGEKAPEMAAAWGKIFRAMLDEIIRSAPKIGQTANTLIQTFLNVLVTNIPRIANAGIRIIIGLLQAMSNNIGRITHVAANLAIRFMQALGREAPRIANAAAKMIVDFVNATAKAIDRQSGPLGRAAGRLGVAIVKGAVKGLVGIASELGNAAVQMAKDAWNRAMDWLRAKSPSRRFMEMGGYVVQGFALGLDDHAQSDKSASGMARSATSAFNKAIGDLSAMEIDLDMQPTITPVLDLSKVKQGAPEVNSLLEGQALAADASYQNAVSILSDQAAKDEEAAASTAEPREVKFEQHNHSPKALSSVEIYRQTKNQISLAKEELGIT